LLAVTGPVGLSLSISRFFKASVEETFECIEAERSIQIGYFPNDKPKMANNV